MRKISLHKFITCVFVLSCQDLDRSVEDKLIGLTPYKIAFSSFRIGEFPDIYIIDTDSKNLITVTDNPMRDIDPIWFPDGKNLLLTSNRSGNWNFYWYNLELGTINQYIYGSGDFNNGSWSTDGSKFVYQSKKEGNEDIYVMDIPTGTVTQLTSDPAVDYSPVWSPDGSKIAFVSMRNRNADIYIMDSQGNNQVQVTDSDFMDLEPTWSPDGKKIAFTTHRNSSDEHIYVIDVVSNEKVKINTAASDEYNPIWSADGEWIYYYNIYLGKIFKSHSNGQGIPEVIFEFGQALDLSITPDNKALIFVAKINNNPSAVNILNLETGEFQRITDSVNWDESPRAFPISEND